MGYGTAIPEPETNGAKVAFDFMTVGMTVHWKHAIVYALQDKCSASVWSQLIRDCISMLYVEGISIVVIVLIVHFTNQQTGLQCGNKMNSMI